VNTATQNTLLNYLRSIQATAAAKAFLKRTSQQFVLEHGWWYEPVQLSDHLAIGTPEQCLTNAVNLVLDDGSLIYCEGYALYNEKSLPVIHAWVTDGNGNAIDNTWPLPGVAYAGVPFKSLFVNTTALKNRAIVSLLDDYQNNYPLRGELGDQPDKWLEVRGLGLTKVTECGEANSTHFSKKNVGSIAARIFDVGGNCINVNKTGQTMIPEEHETIVRQIVNELNQESKKAGKNRVLMGWRTRLEKEPPHLRLHEIDEIMRVVWRRLGRTP